MVIPAKAGIQFTYTKWVPAFAGTTDCLTPRHSSHFQHLKLARIAALGTLLPRILLALQGVPQPLVQGLATRSIFQDPLLHVIHAHALDVVHGAIEIARFLAIELD